MNIPSQKSKPILSVLIINWNGRDDLLRCLESLYGNNLRDTEIVVVDNASEDGSVGATRRLFPDVRLQVNDTNLGHTGGANLGFGLVQGEYVLLLDSDTILPPGSVLSMLSFLQERKDIALVGPRLVNLDGSIQETSKRFPTIMSVLFGRHSTLTRIFPNNPFSRRYLMRDKSDTSEPYLVDSLSSACMLFRHDLLNTVGQWDEGYPGYWVDIDWCLTLHEAGKDLCCLPAVSVIHDESYSPDRKKGARRIWMFHQGAYRLYAKHYSFGVLDPRRLLVKAGLSFRAAMLIFTDSLRSEKPTEALAGKDAIG